MGKPYKIYNKDCVDVMKAMAAKGFMVDHIISDPPYNLESIKKRFGGKTAKAPKHGKDGRFARLNRGFMNQTWDNDIAFSTKFWKLVLKVIKPGGYLFIFGGTRTWHRMACAIENAGFEIRDQISFLHDGELSGPLLWLYGTGFPKAQDASKAIDKHLGAKRTQVPPRSVIGHQRDIGNARPYMSDPNHKTDSDIPATKEAAKWQGFYGNCLKPAWEPILVARKPPEKTLATNILKHNCGALNVEATRVGSSKTVPKSVRRAKCLYGNLDKDPGTTSDWNPNVGRWPSNVIHDGSKTVEQLFNKSTARFFYCSKASKKERNEGCSVKNIHPTVKPISLMQYLCKFVHSEHVIFDPFMGSGSTGCAAVSLGYKFIGCEKDTEAGYFEIAKQRIQHARKQYKLNKGVTSKASLRHEVRKTRKSKAKQKLRIV